MTCLASRHEKDDGLLLATGSQDSLVRLWRVERRKEVEKKETEDELAVTEQVVKLGDEEWLVVVESVLAGGGDGDTGDGHAVSAVDISKRVRLLAGHEGRVYTVAWGNQGELLTASMDRWNSSVSEKSSKISGRSSSGKCKMTSGWTL